MKICQAHKEIPIFSTQKRLVKRANGKVSLQSVSVDQKAMNWNEVLDEKLGEVLGLAQAAQEATSKVAGSTCVSR